MARPKDSDPVATRAAILEAAWALLEQADAPGSVSLRAVAAEVGCSLGTIQYYFPSKRALLDACLDGYHERLRALGHELAQLESAGADRIEKSASAIFAFARCERVSLELVLASSKTPGAFSARPTEVSDLLSAAQAYIAPHCTVSGPDLGLTLRALSAVIVRLALLSDSELKHLTGLDGEAARDAAEAYVARSARRLLRPGEG